MNSIQQAAAVLAWELRHRQWVALSMRTACELADWTPSRTLDLLVSLALCLPIERQASGGWRAVPGAGLRGAPTCPAQRAAVLAWLLASEALTVCQAATATGLKRNSAYVLLSHVSEVLPILDTHRPRPQQGCTWGPIPTA